MECLYRSLLNPSGNPDFVGFALTRDGCLDDSRFGFKGNPLVVYPHCVQMFFLAALLTLSYGLSGCGKLQARDDLNKGVAEFKNGQYDKAVEFFKQAKDLDPNLLNARLYLATAYASQYIPGAPSEENMRHGNEAIQEYTSVLDMDPNNISAIDGLASIDYQMGVSPSSQRNLRSPRATTRNTSR